MGRSSSPLRDRLVFVVGARRSGTNWLQRVLTAHPDVVGVPGETYLFSHGLEPLAGRFQHAAVSSARTGFVYLGRDALDDALRDFCDRVFGGIREALDPDAERICERTPDHVRHLELMGRVYPDAHYVHILRDGRDVVRSLVAQPWGPGSVEEAAAEWRSAVEAARSASAGLERYTEVGYEDLLADPRTGVGALYDAVGLRSSEDVVERVLVEAGVRYNVDRDAPQVKVGKWADSFSPRDLQRVLRIAGPTLRELGYDVDVPARGRSTSSVKKLVGGARGLLRARARDPRTPVERTQAIFHRFLEAVATGRHTDVEGIVSSKAFVRIVGTDVDVEGRGAQAVGSLVDVLAADEVLRAQQLRGDLLVGVPTFTLVATYRTSDGGTHDRVLSAVVEGNEITRVAYYRFPLASR